MYEIREFQPGDEPTQAAIYNAAAAKLPGFKPATSEDVRRRVRARDFDPGTRLYAVSGDTIVGYCTFQSNGRIGYPWCLPGHAAEEELLEAAVTACRARGITRLFTAYRADWTQPLAFFEAHGFHKARDMVNYIQSQLDLPTLVIRRGLNATKLKEEDIPAVSTLVPNMLRLSDEKLKAYFFANPYFSAESFFVVRKGDGTLQGVGLLINNAEYADPMKIDRAAPCFRLGAFGTEGMTAKRINGLFSMLVPNDADATPLGLDLLSYARNFLQDDSLESIAAQVPSDAAHLHGFYQKYFRKQGSFPVFERDLT